MTALNAVLARNDARLSAVQGPHSQSVAFSHYNHLSAQLPVAPGSEELVSEDVAAQADQCLTNIAAIVESIDRKLEDVVRVTVFLTDIADAPVVDEAVARLFGSHAPARTTAAVAALPLGAKVQVDAVVSHGLGTIPDAPQADDLVIVTSTTDKAPASPAASQSVAFSHYNNLSAQLPLDPATGALVEGDVAAQTKQALANVKAILEGMDVPFDDIVKVTVFLTDLADLARVDEVYRTFVPDSGIARTVGYVPARSVVAVTGLPEGAKVQIEAVVSHGDGTPPQEVEDRHGLIIEANDAEGVRKDPLATHTVTFSHYTNTSAMLPEEDGTLVQGDAKAQAAQCLKNLRTVVEGIDHKLEDVVRVSLFLADLADLEAVESAYDEVFADHVPARRVVQVAALPEGVRVQLDAVVANEEGTPPIV